MGEKLIERSGLWAVPQRQDPHPFAAVDARLTFLQDEMDALDREKELPLTVSKSISRYELRQIICDEGTPRSRREKAWEQFVDDNPSNDELIWVENGAEPFKERAYEQRKILLLKSALSSSMSTLKKKGGIA